MRFPERVVKKVDFKIDEARSDDYDVKDSWENFRSVADFFALLFGIKISRMLNIEMMNIMLQGDDDVVTTLTPKRVLHT